VTLVEVGADDEGLAGVTDAREPVVHLGRAWALGEAADLVEHDDPTFRGASGERLAERGLAHALGDPLPVGPAVRAEHDTTMAPVRRARRPLTGAAGPLLPPRLGATAGHASAVLRRGGPEAGVRARGLERLEEHTGPLLRRAQRAGQLDRAERVAIRGDHRRIAGRRGGERRRLDLLARLALRCLGA